MYQELAEHYGTAILPARVRAPKDKAAVEGTVGIISTFILAALRNRCSISPVEVILQSGVRTLRMPKLKSFLF